MLHPRSFLYILHFLLLLFFMLRSYFFFPFSYYRVLCLSLVCLAGLLYLLLKVLVRTDDVAADKCTWSNFSRSNSFLFHSFHSMIGIFHYCFARIFTCRFSSWEFFYFCFVSFCLCHLCFQDEWIRRRMRIYFPLVLLTLQLLVLDFFSTLLFVRVSVAFFISILTIGFL